MHVHRSVFHKIHKTDVTFSLILRLVTRLYQVGSGEIPLDEEELENESETDYQDGFCGIVSRSPQTVHPETIIDVPRRTSSLLCDVYDVNVNITSNLPNIDDLTFLYRLN